MAEKNAQAPVSDSKGNETHNTKKEIDKVNKSIPGSIELYHRRVSQQELVLEKAVADLKAELADLESNSVPVKKYADLKADFDNLLAESRLNFQKYMEYQEKYQKEHSIVINLDGELENVREQLRKDQSINERYQKENQALRELVSLWI